MALVSSVQSVGPLRGQSHLAPQSATMSSELPEQTAYALATRSVETRSQNMRFTVCAPWVRNAQGTHCTALEGGISGTKGMRGPAPTSDASRNVNTFERRRESPYGLVERNCQCKVMHRQ